MFRSFKHMMKLSMFSSLLFLGACGTLFVDAKDKPLPGERVSILELQKQISPSENLQDTPIVLPESWVNKLWPQSGGYPTHAMGHLSLTGSLKKVWSSDIGAGGSDRDPLTATPVVADGKIFTLDTDGVITAFSLDRGKKLWDKSVTPKGEDSSSLGGGLAYDAGKIFATAGYRNLVALSAEDGAVLWSVQTPSAGRAAPAVLDGRVYLSTLDNRLMVYAAGDGALLWSYVGVAETTNLLGAAGVAVDPTIVVLPMSTGELMGLSPVNGNVFWQDNLSTLRSVSTLSTISDIRGLPVIDQGLVFGISYNGRIVALDQATGARLWQREMGSANTPWVAGNAVFVLTSDQELVALSRQTGEVFWVTPLPLAESSDEVVVWTGPVLAGDRLVVVNNNGDMIEINPKDGSVLRQQDVGRGTLLPPVVADDKLFVLADDGTLTAFH